MTRANRLGPLDPIYDIDTVYGAVATGNSPGVPLPSVTINEQAGQTDPVEGIAVLFDVVFSEDVIGFATGDVTLSGTAGATTGTVSGSGSIYTVSVTGMTVAGTVIADVPVACCISVAGSAPNYASTSTDNTVFWEPAFDPGTEVPPYIWVDAADTATITEAANVVSEIDSKGSPARSFNPVFLSGPLTNTRTQNGFNVLDCNADDLWMTGGQAGSQLGTNSLTIIVAFKLDTIKDSNGIWFQGAASQASNGGWYGIFAGNGNLGAYYDEPAVSRVITTAFSATTPTVATQRLNRIGAGSTNILRVNGVQVASTTFADGGDAYSDSNSNVQIISGYAVSGYAMDGAFFEGFQWFSALTDQQIEDYEGYLMDKWAI